MRSPGRAFLERLFALATPGDIELRRHVPGTEDWSRSTWHRTPAAAAAAAVRADAEGLEVFFGVGRRVEHSKGADGVLAIAAVWVDIDPSDEAREDGDLLHEERVEMRRRLLAHEPAPSIIVTSGQGVQAYWLLDEPADPEVVRAVNTALAARLGGDKLACDPARVLRLPGSHHRKTATPLPVGEIWTSSYALHRIEDMPQERARRSYAAPAPKAPPEYPLQPKLLERVLERAPGAKAGKDGKVSHRCPFHEDTKASAVVFPAGWLFCSGCGASMRPLVWTLKPEVEAWDVAGLVVLSVVAEKVPTLPPGFVKAPRSAIRIVGPLLNNRFPVLMPAKRNVLEIRLTGKDGKVDSFENAADLGNALRQVYGPLVHRVFWACLVKAQVDDATSRQRGSFKINVEQLGDALGFPRMSDGRHHPDARINLRRALDALSFTDVQFRWSPNTGWEKGPVIARRGDIDTGDVRFIVHDGVWKQMAGQSPAWVAWDAAALRLDDEALALYLLARWELRHRQVPPLGVLRFDLAGLATRAGVWNEGRLAKDRGRYLQEWERRLARGRGLGLSIEGAGGGSPTLAVRNVVKVSGAGEQLLLGMAEPDPPARPLLPTIYPHPLSSNGVVPRACGPALRARRTSLPRETTVMAAASENGGGYGSGCQNHGGADGEPEEPGE